MILRILKYSNLFEWESDITFATLSVSGSATRASDSADRLEYFGLRSVRRFNALEVDSHTAFSSLPATPFAREVRRATDQLAVILERPGFVEDVVMDLFTR